MTSNGGVVLLRQADRRLDLTAAVARGLADDRQRGKVRHRFVDMLRQRVLGIALGYEDLNDHDALRHDLAVQTAAERDGVLASAPTLCRFENRAERSRARLGQAHPRGSGRDLYRLLRGAARGDRARRRRHRRRGARPRFFHGYYDHYCFLPLYVFAGEPLPEERNPATVPSNANDAEKNPMSYTLGQAARATGKSKTTIHRAIGAGYSFRFAGLSPATLHQFAWRSKLTGLTPKSR